MATRVGIQDNQGINHTVSIATALLEVGNAGANLSTKLYTTATSSVNLDQDLANLASDVALTSTALINVGRYLDVKHGPVIASESAHQDAWSISKRCQESFEELSAMTGSRPSTSRMDRLRMWPQTAHGSRTEILRKKIETLKSSLILLLSILKFHHESHTQYVRSLVDLKSRC
jgi:hypothetical protein